MSEGTRHRYIIALGSNMRVPGIGRPSAVLKAGLQRLAERGCDIVETSPIVSTRPLGHSARSYANAAALVESRLGPPVLLDELQQVETEFGRNRRGRRWRARTLDLDIALWNGGEWEDPRLAIPHPEFRDRDFVLGPAASIAPHWRDPRTGLTLAQLKARLTRPRPLLR